MNVSCDMICCEVFVYHRPYGLIKSFYSAQFVLVVSKVVCFYIVALTQCSELPINELRS